ncbi:MAG: alpha-E domain-containing protein [Comamonadaceae bacterium]|nr:alpha-E domain-containing protein [Comamonadaceae bacterium]
MAYNLAALERASQALRERLSAEHWRPDAARWASGFAQRACAAPRAGELPHAGAGAAGAGPAGAAAGRRDRRADRPHDARPRLAPAHRGPPARAPDRPGRALAAPSLQARRAGAAPPASTCCWSCSTAPSPSAPATSATRTCWPLADLLVLDSANPRAFAGVLRRLRTELTQAARRRRRLADAAARAAAGRRRRAARSEALRGAERRRRSPRTLPALSVRGSAERPRASAGRRHAASATSRLAHGAGSPGAS